MKLLRPVLLTLLLAAVAAVAAACGSSSSGSAGDADPAGGIPAGAPVYVEGVVRPDGKLGSDVDAVLKKILRTNDPGAKLHGLIDKSGKKDGVTYKDDIEPWLGQKIGVAVTSVAGAKPDYLAVAGSKDDGKARAALGKGKKKTVKRSYKGVDYRFDPSDGTAATAFGGRAYVGTERALKGAIDLDKSGGSSLSDANALRAAREKVASERAGFAYFDVQGLLRLAQAGAAGKDPQFGAALQAFGGALPKTVAAALEADPDLIRIDAVSTGTPAGQSSGKSGADAVAKAPGDAFLAAGVADIGGSIERSLKTLGGSGLGGVGIEAVLRQVQEKTGLDVRRDLLSWMGDGAIYVAGDSVESLHGALVVTSTNPARTKTAIAKIRRLARTMAAGARVKGLSGVDAGFAIAQPGSPEVDVALQGDKFVIAIGKGAIADAVKPSSALGDNPAFSSAQGKLGDGIRPAFFLDMTRVTALIGSKAGGDPKFAQAKPYLDVFSALVGGAKNEGEGVTRARFAITLK